MLPQVQTREDGGERFAALITKQKEVSEGAQSILLHSCCGPCSTSVVERLTPDFDVTVFFYNPNITDPDEYERRLDAQRRFVEKYNDRPEAERKITLAVGVYEPEKFLARARGYEAEPEGGSRCALCFSMRLECSAEYAAIHGFERFTTTLSVSPRKDHELICGIGTRLAMRFGLEFYRENFRKKDGYRRGIELSRAYGLYRQNYCGCEFSRRENDEPSR